MRHLSLVLGALAIALPGRGQPPEQGPSNVAGDRALQNAIRSFDPHANHRILVGKPPGVCAVRLIEVPVSQEVDTGILARENRLTSDSDKGMIVHPPTSACPKDGEQARP